MKTKILIATLLAGILNCLPAHSQDRVGDNCSKTYWLYLYESEKRLNLSAADSAFMKKYNVTYKGYYCHLFGQEAYYANADYDNCYTYQELDKHYGKEWRTEVNKKAVALNDEDKYKKEIKKAIKDRIIYVPVKVPVLKISLYPEGCF